MNRALVFTVIGLAGVIFLGIFLWVGDDTSGVTYRLEELKRGDIKKVSFGIRRVERSCNSRSWFRNFWPSF